MATDEMRAAAERWACGNYPAVDMPEPWRSLFRQGEALGKAWLAEHPDDGSRPCVECDRLRALVAALNVALNGLAEQRYGELKALASCPGQGGDR